MACKAYKQASSGSSVCWRKATMIASSIDGAVDFASFDPVGRSPAAVRFLHLATVFWLMPGRFSALRLSHYAVSLDGSPLSCGRSHVAPVP